MNELGRPERSARLHFRVPRSANAAVKAEMSTLTDHLYEIGLLEVSSFAARVGAISEFSVDGTLFSSAHSQLAGTVLRSLEWLTGPCVGVRIIANRRQDRDVELADAFATCVRIIRGACERPEYLHDEIFDHFLDIARRMEAELCPGLGVAHHLHEYLIWRRENADEYFPQGWTALDSDNGSLPVYAGVAFLYALNPELVDPNLVGYAREFATCQHLASQLVSLLDWTRRMDSLATCRGSIGAPQSHLMFLRDRCRGSREELLRTSNLVEDLQHFSLLETYLSPTVDSAKLVCGFVDDYVLCRKVDATASAL